MRAEILENQIFDILEVLFSAKEVCLERLRNLVADQYRHRSTEKVVQELERLKSELGQCHLKQSKLTDAYLEGMISREIFEEKSQKLRNEEGETRIKIERLELQLVEKEESEDYIKRAQMVVKSTQSIKENLDPATRKDFLKLVFKKLPIENQTIAMVELYEPFNAMYRNALAEVKAEGADERRGDTWRQEEMGSSPKSQSCLLRPSVGHWMKLGMTLLPKIMNAYGIAG